LALIASASFGVLVHAPPASATNDCFYDRQWGLKAVGAPAAWATGTGAGTTIAVVDTGVDLQHEDLKTKISGGKNFVDPAKSAQDDHGHGTHVAGIAAAAANNNLGVASVAPDARILPVKVLDSKGQAPSGSITEEGIVEAGIRYAADQGAAVINLSLGDTGITRPLGSSFASAVRYAWSKGSIPVVSAGNNGDPNSTYFTSSNFANEPAIVVTALTPSSERAPYASKTGAAKWGIAAPGGAGTANADDNIISTWWLAGSPNAYGSAAGTSMAAPHVSGAAAILRGLGLTPQQTVDRLLATARDLGDPGNDSTYGHGALDVAKAVAGLGSGGSGGANSGTGGCTRTPTTTRTGVAGGGATTATTRRLPATAAPTAGATTPTVAEPAPATTVAVLSGEAPASGDATTASGSNRNGVSPLAPASGERRAWPALLIGLALLIAAGTLLQKRVKARPG
jgi:thermitase